MELNRLLVEADPNLLIFFATSLFAFLSWLVKGLVEKPLSESRTTFNHFLEKRLEILTEVKMRLNLIAYFPLEEESKEFKEQLQGLLLKDGRTGYLNKSTFDSIVKLAITPITDELLLLDTLDEIDKDLYGHISKIEDEVRFYRKFSHFNPIRRLGGFIFLAFQYAFSFCLMLSLIAFILWVFSLFF